MRFAGQRHSLLGKLSYPLLRAIAGRVHIPARELAPLEASSSSKPLIVFSHGLAGTRHTYSSFCSSLAAQGYVVLAIEHKDGSGPAVTVRGGSDKPEILEYMNKDELDWSPDATPSSPMPLRHKQLELRLRETYEAYYGFKRLINGETVEGLGVVGDYKEDVARSWLDSLKGKVEVNDQVIGIGHSFGGATMLHLLQSPSPEPETLPTIPLKACIALDPWMEPVPDPAPGSKPPKIPTMVINSDGFTVWTNHFAKLYQLVERANGSLLSIVGSDHQSFSDFPMLVPPSPAFAISLLDTIHNLTAAFLDGGLKEAKEVQGKSPDNGRPEIVGGGTEGKRRLKGEKGEVLVHCFGVDP